MLTPVPANFIDAAWAEGASELARACDTSGGEIEGPQLKMLLSRGERTLIRMERDETGRETVGWGVVRIDQLPNMRVLFVTDMVAPNAQFQTFLGELKAMAKQYGCSRVRCAAKPSQSRLYRMKAGARPVYEVLEWESL